MLMCTSLDTRMYPAQWKIFYDFVYLPFDVDDELKLFSCNHKHFFYGINIVFETHKLKNSDEEND